MRTRRARRARQSLVLKDEEPQPASSPDASAERSLGGFIVAEVRPRAQQWCSRLFTPFNQGDDFDDGAVEQNHAAVQHRPPLHDVQFWFGVWIEYLACCIADPDHYAKARCFTGQPDSEFFSFVEFSDAGVWC